MRDDPSASRMEIPVATRVEQESGIEWKPVPLGDPGRPAFEAQMRPRGITPASDRAPRLKGKPRRASLGEVLLAGLRRVWYGPPPEPLTDDELRFILRPVEEDDGAPERVPPDDPARLAWEAELRAIGVTPARKWNFPEREPIRRPGLWKRIKYRIGLGW